MPLVGRPRQFDTDAALGAAMIVFWARGYLGASMEDLTTAMGINRASLYGAFGDKQRLFLACIDRYLERNGAGARSALEAVDVADALRDFFRAVVENSTGAKTPPGCLVACVLVGASSESPEIGNKLQECMRMTDTMLEARLARAASEGQLASGTDIAAMARLANSLRHGLTIRARAGEPRCRLLETVNQATAMVLSFECFENAGAR